MQTSAWGDSITQHFYELTPESILESVESAGYECTGRCIPLNSFENRVFEVEVEPHPSLDLPNCRKDRVVVKFYRPGRWNAEQIGEEHAFLDALKKAEIPVIAPITPPEIEKLSWVAGDTLFQSKSTDLFGCFFPKVGGRSPDEFDPDKLQWIGRLLARIHTVGATLAAQRKKPSTRVRLNPASYGEANLQYLIEKQWIPKDMEASFRNLYADLTKEWTPLFQSASAQLIHGDCHRNNLLWNSEGPFFLDFDDCVIAPPVQDLWLLLSSSGSELRAQLEELLEGYELFRPFDRSTLQLIEPLRALRFLHFAGWIARRWEDPSFPRAFPYFGNRRYWDDLYRDLQNTQQHHMPFENSFD